MRVISRGVLLLLFLHGQSCCAAFTGLWPPRGRSVSLAAPATTVAARSDARRLLPLVACSAAPNDTKGVAAAAATPRPSTSDPSTAIVTAEVFENVKRELWRTSEADPAALVSEQRDVITSLIGEIAALPSREAGDGDPLNGLVAPHLPLLLTPSFPLAVRDSLGAIRGSAERAALLSLCKLVTSVQAEIGEALVELQWRQQQKLRELCDVATDGGTDRVIELAEAMKDELDVCWALGRG